MKGLPAPHLSRFKVEIESLVRSNTAAQCSLNECSMTWFSTHGVTYQMIKTMEKIHLSEFYDLEKSKNQKLEPWDLNSEKRQNMNMYWPWPLLRPTLFGVNQEQFYIVTISPGNYTYSTWDTNRFPPHRMPNQGARTNATIKYMIHQPTKSYSNHKQIILPLEDGSRSKMGHKLW